MLNLVLPRTIPEELPPNDYLEYYTPSYRLHVPPQRIIENQNTRLDVERIKQQVLENLAQLEHAPSESPFTVKHLDSHNDCESSYHSTIMRAVMI